jgi:putative transposase
MYFENSTVKLPQIGEIKVVFHKTVEGELKTVTFSKSCTGKYYISILGEDGKEVPVKQAFSESTTIGVDFRITDFAVMSTEKMVENPKYLKNSLKKLKVLQKS